MDNTIVSTLVTGAAILIMLIVLLWFIITIGVLVKLNNRFKHDSTALQELKEGNKERVVEYSKQVLEFIRMMVGQVAVIKFRTFIDNRKIEKISKANVEELVADVARTVNRSINMSNIQIENTVYSREFFEEYIIESSVMIIKDLLARDLNNITDEEDKGGNDHE